SSVRKPTIGSTHRNLLLPNSTSASNGVAPSSIAASPGASSTRGSSRQGDSDEGRTGSQRACWQCTCGCGSTTAAVCPSSSVTSTNYSSSTSFRPSSSCPNN